MKSLTQSLANAHVVVTVGRGGVGKTSTAAALGLAFAREGRRTLVLTIDPARRLLQALGLQDIGFREHILESSAFLSQELPVPAAPYSTRMLDTQDAWHRVVREHHPNPKEAEELLNNRFFRVLSSMLTGSQEYMAMEALYQIVQRKEDPLDVIVLDTPPAENAVDFLEAPDRMLDALDNDATRWLLDALKPNKKGFQGFVFDVGASVFVKTVAKLTGSKLLEELAVLLKGFHAMLDGFQARARAVEKILQSEKTQFVLVDHARPGTEQAIHSFVLRLHELGCHIHGLILNRSLEPAPTQQEIETSVIETDPSLKELNLKLLTDLAHVRKEKNLMEKRWFVELEKKFPKLIIQSLPELSQDVRDLKGLSYLSRFL